MTYQETIDYIHGISWSFCKPGLERISLLCEKLGHPEKGLKFIHVGGTNGKGSFCAMTEAILRAAGYKTGLYTSPYIRDFNERMRVNGENIPNETLVEITEYVRPFADAMEDKPTECELITAIAFEYFRREKCDVVVLEVGLGGRLDSTNIIESPLLSVITGIDFDHTNLLGSTIQEIAREKGGIIKPHCPALYGGNENSACRVLSLIADSKQSDFYAVDQSAVRVKEYSPNGTVLDFKNMKDLRLSLLGTYQPENAATVLSAVELLNSRGILNVPESAVRQGFSSVRWMARFEKLRDGEPTVIFDGAHNPQGIKHAVKSIEIYFPNQKVNVLSGVMEDKDYDGIIEGMKPIAARVFTVTPSNPRALSAQRYAEVIRSHGIPAASFESVDAGLAAAIAESRVAKTPLFCLGSLYLYGEISKLIEEIN